MISSIKHNVIRILFCAVLWTVPSGASAQSAGITESEMQCVSRTTRSVLQDARTQKHLHEIVLRVREQVCVHNKAEGEYMGVMMAMQTIPNVISPPMLTETCFASNAQRMQENSTAVYSVIEGEVAHSLPRPICP